MAYTNIDLPTEYFNTKLYTGTGATNSLTGVGFQPDWVWIKKRSADDSHSLYDVVRGTTKSLRTNATDAEQTRATTLTSFDADGFTLSTNNEVNASGATFVAWNWLANGTGVSNTDGTIASTVSANTTSGFSIVSYTGNGTSGATVGHGLGVAPKMVILKVRNTTGNWRVGNISASSNFSEVLNLNLTNAKGLANSIFNSTAPSSTVFTLGNEGDANGSGNTFVAYCFAEVKGYSKFGSYTGNGSTDGTFIYTGFKPAFVIIKNSSSANDWMMFDSVRNTYNATNLYLQPNNDTIEASGIGDGLDFLSNGFKIRSTNGTVNTSGNTYIYMSFASNPFVTSGGIPVTAR